MGTGISPEKILIVLFVALIVLGPDKLPELARKIGKAWGDLRHYRESLESEVRGAFGVAEGTNPFASPLSFLTDPPATGPAGDTQLAQAANATAPVSNEAAPGTLTPVPADPLATVAPGGTADDWAATVTAGWDSLGAEATTVPATTGPGATQTGPTQSPGPDESQADQAERGVTATPGQRPVPQPNPGPAPWAGLGVGPDDPSLN